VLANTIADEVPSGVVLEASCAAGALAAPDLVDGETTAVLRKRWLAGAISDQRFAVAIEDLEDLALDRYPTLPLMRRAYELRANVTAYDAAYIALAEVLGCELRTGDRRLTNAPGPHCATRLLS
jgi:predicted nucleic acid-binding protein